MTITYRRKAVISVSRSSPADQRIPCNDLRQYGPVCTAQYGFIRTPVNSPSPPCRVFDDGFSACAPVYCNVQKNKLATSGRSCWINRSRVYFARRPSSRYVMRRLAELAGARRVCGKSADAFDRRDGQRLMTELRPNRPPCWRNRANCSASCGHRRCTQT